MFLAAAEATARTTEQSAPEDACFARWESFPISVLDHHGDDCCAAARSWFRAMDFAQLNGGDRLSGPRWVRQRYEWGPSQWPLHWCEALDAGVVDCGAHSALAHEAFEARGLTSFRAQFVQRYDGRAIDQWRTRWARDGVSDHWLGDDFIYHEGNALVVGPGDVKLWDGSAGCWLNHCQTDGYASLLALRIATRDAADLRWGTHRVATNRWQRLHA